MRVVSLLILLSACVHERPKTVSEILKGTEYRFDQKKKVFTTGLGKMQIKLHLDHFLINELVCYNEFELSNICEFRDDGK